MHHLKALATLWMVVTAYVVTPDHRCDYYTGRTASGAYAHRGTLAADTRRYPFGTRFSIPGYGLGIVQDTGSDISGNRLDVAVTSCKEAWTWGRKTLRVTIVK